MNNSILSINKKNVTDEQTSRGSYEIGNMDRFEWYNNISRIYKPKKNTHSIPKKIFIYFAYEFEHEYSIIYTTPIDIGVEIYCRYFDKTSKEIHKPVKSVAVPKLMVNCPKRPGTERVALSVTKDGVYDLTIPLIDRMPKAEKYELSLCLPTIYGNEPKWLMLAEMIEHYKLQGVEHFYVYAHKLDEYDSMILEDYVRTGEAEIHFMLEVETTNDGDWHLISNKDCLLRSRGESRWSIFADIDERLIMTEYPGTILDYLRNITDPKISGIQFRQRWILKDKFLPEKYKNDKQIEEWMPTRRWHNTSSPGPRGHTTKCVIDPKKVFSMWTHWPDIPYPGYKLRELKPEEGIVRHYRDVNLGDWGNRWFKEVSTFGPMQMTNYPENYLKNLTENVKQRVKYVYSSKTR